MATDLLLIGKTGALAARAALDVTGQNIANANNEDYNRRSVDLAEVAATGGIGRSGDARLAGVRIDGIVRTSSAFLQAEVRRTGSDSARANTQVQALEGAERAVETSGIYPALVEFEAGLARLAADPLSTPLRTQVVENARNLTDTFGLAMEGLNSSAAGLRLGAQDGVARINQLTAGLAQTNTNLGRTQEGTVSRAALLDQRDALLSDLASLTGIHTEFDAFGRVTVRLRDNGGHVVITGDTAQTLGSAFNADGTLAITLGTGPVILETGSVAGQAQALERIASLRTGLDAIANQLIATTNSAQASGVDPAGNPGAPLFSGTGAAGIGLALTSGAGLATAPAGSPAGSRDTGNLAALQSALANGGPTAAMDGLIFGLSSEISGRSITRDALQSIADSAASSLANETAVDLDSEAANLVRFQQAFQASGRVIQVASDIFDTLLAIR